MVRPCVYCAMYRHGLWYVHGCWNWSLWRRSTLRSWRRVRQHDNGLLGLHGLGLGRSAVGSGHWWVWLRGFCRHVFPGQDDCILLKFMPVGVGHSVSELIEPGEKTFSLALCVAGVGHWVARWLADSFTNETICWRKSLSFSSLSLIPLFVLWLMGGRGAGGSELLSSYTSLRRVTGAALHGLLIWREILIWVVCCCWRGTEHPSRIGLLGCFLTLFVVWMDEWIPFHFPFLEGCECLQLSRSVLSHLDPRCNFVIVTL